MKKILLFLFSVLMAQPLFAQFKEFETINYRDVDSTKFIHIGGVDIYGAKKFGTSFYKNDPLICVELRGGAHIKYVAQKDSVNIYEAEEINDTTIMHIISEETYKKGITTKDNISYKLKKETTCPVVMFNEANQKNERPFLGSIKIYGLKKFEFVMPRPSLNGYYIIDAFYCSDGTVGLPINFVTRAYPSHFYEGVGTKKIKYIKDDFIRRYKWNGYRNNKGYESEYKLLK